MKANVKLLTNSEKLKKAEKMGTECEPNFDFFPVYFDPRAIGLAFVNMNQEIRIFMYGQMWDIEYSDEVWHKIKSRLEPL